MPHQPDSTDPLQWHKYFAMENNNTAWALAAMASRSNDENEAMLDAAHAAAAHWKVAGTQQHIARAELLVAAVHCLCELPETAWTLATRTMRFFESHEAPDWETAYVHLIHAHAAAISGRESEHRSSYARATAALHQIADAEDRKVVQASFDQVPHPEPLT